MIILIIQLIYQFWYLFSSLILEYYSITQGNIFELLFFFFPTGSPTDNPVASSRSVSRTSSCVQQQQTTAKCGIMAVSPIAFTVAMEVIISTARWAVRGQWIRPGRRLTALPTNKGLYCTAVGRERRAGSHENHAKPSTEASPSPRGSCRTSPSTLAMKR